jgi:hypothetical protein
MKITLDELIARLQELRSKHGGAVEVRTAWEGIWRPLAPHLIEYDADAPEPAIYIDADPRE